MKAGQTVTYVKGKASKDARIIEHTGSGPSGYKTLTLDVDGKVVTDVPHARDDAGKGHWTEHAGSAGHGSEHAAPVRRRDKDAPSSVVPESTDKGRAAAVEWGESE